MATRLGQPGRAPGGSTDALSPARLRARAVRWLAQREHSRSELAARLLAWAQAAWAAQAAQDANGQEADPSDPSDTAEPMADLAQRVAEVMEQLAAQHWQSDDRFVESRVNARQARWGTRRIALELKQHGLALSADTRDQLHRTELARAHALWARRYGAAPADAADFARQSRFLLARGFAQDTVRQVVPRPGQACFDDDGHDSVP